MNNRSTFYKLLIYLCFIPAVIFIIQEKAEGREDISMLTGAGASFTNTEEFQSHTEGSKSCSNEKCHTKFKPGNREFQHEPVSEGKCNVCHDAQAYPAKYGLERNQLKACSSCHKGMEYEVQKNQFVHGPIKNGDCTSCHDPHGSDTRFILKKPYNDLCSVCHNLKGLYAGKFVHKPVKDGNCGLCHDPHSSNYKSRLTDVGANLCFSCHENILTGMSQKHVHEPLIKSGCSDCHDPHSGKDRLRLTESSDQICYKCHEEKKNEITQYTLKHEPASAGKCISCHSPHFSESRYLLLGKVDLMCYSCHKENSQWKERKFQHGPVVQGNCVACHNPHGSDNPYILRLAFPHSFYSPYEKGKYNLCFLCHKEAMVTTEITQNATYFRNGEKNLHMLHVNQEKGRTCGACHDVHASDQEDHIREEFRFGQADIPIYYFKTDTGGKCVPGCHVERMYDRVKEVKNIRKKKKSKPAKKY